MQNSDYLVVRMKDKTCPNLKRIIPAEIQDLLVFWYVTSGRLTKRQDPYKRINKECQESTRTQRPKLKVGAGPF
jgi:hypothetical protein